MAARMIPSRKAHDILLGHLACLLALGGVPRKGVYDNEAALVSRHGGRCCGSPKSSTVDHRNPAGVQRGWRVDVSLRGGQAITSWPSSSSTAIGSSQQGQQPPSPTLRMALRHSSHRRSPMARAPQRSQA